MLLLTTTDPRAINLALDSIPTDERRDIRIALPLFSHLAGALFPNSSVVVRVFADGSVRGVAGGDSGAAQTGSLGIGIEHAHESMINASISVASSIDTVAGGFGQRILVPMSGKALASGLLDIRLDRSFLRRHGRLARLFPEHEGNPVAVTIELGLALRWLEGDVGEKANDSLRTKLLNSPHHSFFGPQASLQLTFGALTGSLDIYLLNVRRFGLFGYNAGRGDVRGLTGAQVSAGFRVDVPLFVARL